MTGRGAAENSDVTSGIARVAMAEIVHALLSDAEVALFARFARHASFMPDSGCSSVATVANACM
jgi:hypothetical protein